MYEIIGNFLENLTKIENYVSRKDASKIIDKVLTQIKKIKHELQAIDSCQDQNIELDKKNLEEVVKKNQGLLLNIVAENLNESEELCNELREQIILSIPSNHELQIKEKAGFESKLRWAEQFIKFSPAQGKESKNNKADNLSENNYSQSNNSITESNKSSDTASFSDSLSSVTSSLFLVRSASNLSNSTEKSSVSSDNQKLGKAHRKKNITSLLDNSLGDNHQVDRSFLHEVKSKYKLTPNLDSVNPKVNSSHFSPTPSRRKRNFIEENKKAVSSPSMKR